MIEFAKTERRLIGASTKVVIAKPSFLDIEDLLTVTDQHGWWGLLGVELLWGRLRSSE